ncbi:MAG: sulfotransferase [Chitinophagales bacterium]|nr:sulfotransferase [Chitinophagales bacterium]
MAEIPVLGSDHTTSNFCTLALQNRADISMHSIFFIHFKTIGDILKLNIFSRFHWKRALTTIVFLVLYLLLVLLVLFFRLLDEILFPAYRKVQIKEPLFIISNPRSGTTFLHRLLCLDEEKWIYTKLYETILPSVTLLKLIDLLAIVDNRIGKPMRRFFEFLDRKIFGGWKDIHPMGFNKSEEDEGFYVFSTLTAGLFLLVPFLADLPLVRFPDKMSQKNIDRYMRNYENSLKRIMFAKGSNAIYLSKNVLSTGRLHGLINTFPDAHIVYLIRHPYKSVPSLTSMFKAAWSFHSPDIPDDSELTRGLGQLAIDFYKYFDSMRDKIPSSKMLTIRYEDLVEDPVSSVENIYSTFNYTMEEDFKVRLKQNSTRSKNYKSTHDYTLEKFGFKKDDIFNQLQHVFERFNFER